MTTTGPDLSWLDEMAPEPEAKAPTKKARGSKLPSPPPDATATQQSLVQWLSAACALSADPVDRVERYGRGEDGRIVIVLASGQRVTIERAADAFDPRRLERIIVLATAAPMTHYGSADSAAIAGVLVRAADLVAEHDARDEAHGWGSTFLNEVSDNVLEVAGLGTPAGNYEALSTLSGWRAPEESYMVRQPPARRAPLVYDPTTGLRWIRTSDFGAHVRSEGVRIGWGALHSRMIEIGWTHRGEVEQRQPKGHGKAKCHVYEIPAEWDA
jgi:hypothetical protein